jgi:TRAP-type C4-dicarboxylate transport system permease small subunit
MGGALGLALRAADALARTGARLGAAALLAGFAIVIYGVACRYFLGRPQSWPDEVAGWMVVATVMLAAADAERRSEHIGVDALVLKLPRRARRWATAAAALSVAAVAYFLVDEGLEMVAFSHMLGIVSNRLPQVPMWTVQSLVPIGGALLLAAAIANIVRAWRDRERPAPPTPPGMSE